MTEQNGTPQTKGITRITVSGFKSLRDESYIEVRPLTILAGANSSGKSSIMQPLLMLKQTLETSYDPGPLLLNGPNVKFANTKEFLIKSDNGTYRDFTIKITCENDLSLGLRFSKQKSIRQISLVSTEYTNGTNSTTVTSDDQKVADSLNKDKEDSNDPYFLTLSRAKFFIDLELIPKDREHPLRNLNQTILYMHDDVIRVFETNMRYLIHVPGLRGNPERAYVFTPVFGPAFQGRFEYYSASIINHWWQNKSNNLRTLREYLTLLNLSSHITAKQPDETSVEVMVGRHHKSTSRDLVNIADVGFGVSQVLPVLVALLVAEPNQLVYIEQPELHLHPRAQTALAKVLADAANRGVRIVVETHSDLLILGIQTLIAQGKLGTDKVKLHWFTRNDEGVTQIDSRELDEFGAYGDWPEDFADVAFKADSDYLDAIEERRAKQRGLANGS